MTQQLESKINGKIDVNELMSESSQFHTNISQNVVLTTEDKLELCLRKHQDTLKAKSEWKTPIGILIPLVPILVTSEFKDIFGVASETWRAIFIIGCIAIGLWSIKTIYHAFTLKNDGNIEKIISDIKKSSKK